MDTIQGSKHIAPMDKYIPLHLVTEILLRLPVKSLVKFRYVSKSWLSLISSPQFVKAHLKYQKSPHNQRLLMVDDLDNFKHCSLNSLLYGKVSPHVIDLDIQITPGPSTITRDRISYDFVTIVGCCDGLICIFAGRHGGQPEFILWNPSIRNYKKLPDLGLPSKDSSPWFWGFGYDGLSDDYKVIIISHLFNGASERFQTRVYDMKTVVWRRIGNFPSAPTCVSPSGVLVEGKLHFLACHDDVSEGRCIVSLDLATETYGELEVPDHNENDALAMLGEIGGKLFLYKPYLQERYPGAADLWIMKEYGESWTKVITFSIQPPKALVFPQILAISANCDLLTLDCQKMGLYNSRGGESLGHFRELKNVHDASCFVESLIWPTRIE